MTEKKITQKKTDLFRARIASLLAEPQDWLGYEDIRHWLLKLLKRDPNYKYTEAEREAVFRIITARTPFDGWAEHSVPELIAAAMQYTADFDYDDEVALKYLEASSVNQVTLIKMKWLVGLCRLAGVDIPRFDPKIGTYEEAA